MNLIDKQDSFKYFSINNTRNLIQQITGYKPDVGIKSYRGLYFVVKLNIKGLKSSIDYIGISSNIHKRIMYCSDHPYNILYDKFIDNEDVDIVLLSIKCEGKRHSLEKKLVNIFKPELNIHYKGKKYE